MLMDKLLTCVEELNGKCSFVIKNFMAKECFSYDENLVVPSASLIKVPILIEAVRQIKSGELSPDLRLTVKPEDKAAFSVLQFLDSGNSYTLFDLLKLMIIYSDNTAANVLIDLLGMENVNGCMAELGLQETRLRRKMMDFHAREKGFENHTTAREMETIMTRLYKGELIDRQCSDFILDIMKGQADECMMRVDLPDELVIARKSGELERLNHEAAIVYGKNCDYLYLFFAWGTATNNETREIIQKTSKIVHDYFEMKEK
ncbi:serine hydrolase [Sinanaerobacter chloroacetimidivorans]|uniref:Serine hydrolase n=1 Tax=Sinanaerobacter chloroacetimidivorans TaxID=2818044 RepID=A0A8J8B307_9FIRM|nr:serine hydrolase [Sinanaerobacter chloroacetimidivorans]MBR0597820.1 serine hydrolase [Sinanaerobacter chloroacetimidivorans]